MTTYSSFRPQTQNLVITGDTTLGDASGDTITVNGSTLNLAASAARIRGDFSNATVANRVAFQNSTTNASTSLTIIPNGTGPFASANFINNSDPTNASTLNIQCNATDVRLQSSLFGSGTYLPMTFYTGGSERLRIDTSGNVGIGVSTVGTNNKLSVQGVIGVSGSTNATAPLPSAAHVSSSTIRLGVRGSLMTSDESGLTAVGTYLSNNVFFRNTSGNPGYITASSVSQIALIDDTIRFRRASSGTADTDITFTETMRIDSSGNVGIGTSSPTYGTLEVAQGSAGVVSVINNTVGAWAFRKVRSDGSNGMGIYDTSGFGVPAFYASGSERMRITSDGDLCIGATTSGSSRLRATRTNGQNVLYVSQEAATNSSTAVVYQTVAGGNGNQNIGLIVAIQAANTGDRIITGQFWNSGAPQDKFYVQRDGTTNNATGSYGTISDVRIKQDIIDATPQWEDFKKIKFRKYRMISDVEALGNDAPYLMGAVAQELEAAGMKGLVETPLDAEGNETDLHKTVKLSIMYMKGMKALQEAMERIEILETRLNALEGN